MGVQGLQDYIEAHCQRACVSVELQRIARGRVGKRPPNAPLCLVVDAENCLHRLYGGSFRDWVCGGQWNEMLAFIGALTRACHAANIELVVCFNGAVEKPRLPEWIKRQNNNRQTAYQIFCHLHNKATPPPKVWFTPPVSLASCIRLALRHYGVRCYQSLTDHHHEVMAFCRQHEFHGVVARDSDYAVFDPPRYFSSEKLKLSRNGRSLTTVQYLMDEVGKELGLTPEKLVVFAALLGNHILPDEDLASFHWALLGPTHPLAGLKVRAHQLVLPPCDVVIKAVAEYVKNLPSVDDLDKVAQDVFQHSETRKDDKMKKFKESVMYYRAGTKDGNWPILQAVDPQPSTNQEPDADTDHTPQQQPQECAGARDATMPEIVVSEVMESAQQGNPQIVVSKELDTVNEDLQNALRSEIEAQLEDDLDRKMQNMTLETIEDSSSETSTLDSSQELTNIATASEENKAAGDMSPSERFSPKVAWEKITREEEEREREEALRRGGDPAAEDSKGGPPMVTRMASPASQASTSDTTSTTSSSANPTPETKDPTAGIPSLMSTPVRPYLDVTIPKLPTISPSVLRTAQYRHKLGLMNPWIYQIITQGEIKIDLTLEDEAMKDLPSAAELWRPARQLTYGILFNVAHQGKKKKGKEQAPRRQVIVKEWCVQKGRSIQKPELVEALPLDWKVPKVKQLWFGQEVEDKNRRLRAFLSCMLADTPAMLKPLYVPHHLLVLCCVLRYMLQWPGRPLLRRHELDAFLAQSVDPRLANPQALEAMQVPMVTTRGVQIAALFMRGVETAMFANEACGAPVVWELTCPWLFFDGKLFHTKLLKSSANKPLRELCDGQMDQVAKVERMRQSILEGLTNDWARMPLPRMGPMGMGGYGGLLPPPNLRPAGLGPLPGRGRGLAGKPVSGRGGKLQIAGIPVGEWAGNPSGVGNYQPPQVTSVGGYRKGVSYQIPPRGRGMARGGMAMRGRGAMHPMYHGARSAAAWGIQDPGMYYDYSQATPYYMGTYPLPGQQYRNKKNKKNKKGNNKGGKAQEQGQGQGPGGVGEAGDATSQLAGITLALRNKVQSKGRGRGCTVETGDAEVGGGAIPVSQLGSGEGKDVATEEEDVEQTANGDLMELDSAPVEVADGDVEVSSSEESEDEDDLVATVTTTVLEEAAEVSSTGQEGEVPDVTIAELETDAPTLGKGSLLEEEEHDLSTDSGELQNGSVMSPDSGLEDHSTPEKPSSLTDTATSQEVQG
ncbi:PREDICTED: constitutive coactivator of PPAR-gamma-like protein 1 homolog isoform X5 [Branchiostoma belcheri]|uniref:Constitutive coactivator of PPAR-gamma-like protein 1 homolog isoform X5 n=1 Tax=Branchiostoma belcheri TaxID=7741 RepID=A0A6P4Z6R9_BRABE|nr:PREDICTED: constitutive coactivator of PPAR-gamma-like protein 1 homolog isoform X5 [Branchiostoma belcheri]